MKSTSSIKRVLILSLAFAFFVAPVLVFAQDPAAEDTVINANIGSTISLTTSSTVNLNVTPTIAGSATSASDTVTVATNSSSGYILTLENNDANTSLADGSNTIDAHTGTQAAPATLANNSWGYRVDGIGGFGAGPTVAQNNQADLSGQWAGVPALNNPDTIKNTSSPAAGDTTTVWYGVKADTSNPDGTYSDTVLYTATANP